MVDLVADNERATSLSADDTRKLYSMIDTSKRKDKPFYELCRNARKLFQTGETGELEGLEDMYKVVINLAHSHIASLLPTIFFKEPTIICSPTSPRHDGKQQTWQALLNNTNRKVGLKRETSDVLLDSLVYPEAWMKVMANRPVEEPGTQADKEHEAAESGKQGETEWLGKGAPVFARVSPLQTIVDYRSINRRLDNARFVCFVYAKNLDELRADPRYDVPAEIDTTHAFKPDGEKLSISNGFIDPFVEEGGFGEQPVESDHDHYVYVYETWVYQMVGMKLKRHLVCMLVGDNGLLHDKPIRFETWEDALGQHVKEYPFARLEFHPVPDALPNSELGVWSSIHGAINWLTTRMVQIVDSEKTLYEVVKEKVKNYDKFVASFKESKNMRELLEVEEIGSVGTVRNQSTPRDNYGLMNFLQDSVRQVGGLGENRQGATGIRTATEASNVETGVRIKTEKKVDVVQDWFVELTYKEINIIRSLIADQGDTIFVFNIGGETGAVEWLRFTKEDIDWVPEINIEVHSFNKATREGDVQRALLAFQNGLQLFPLKPDLRIDILYKNLLKSLEISGIAEIVDSQQDHMILQAVELVNLLNGGDSPVESHHDHAAHMRLLQMFLNAPEIVSISSANPEGFQAVLEHFEQHNQFMEMAAQAQTSQAPGPNPFDTNINGGSPANEARQRTAFDREAANPATPGSGGLR